MTPTEQWTAKGYIASHKLRLAPKEAWPDDQPIFLYESTGHHLYCSLEVLLTDVMSTQTAALRAQLAEAQQERNRAQTILRGFCAKHTDRVLIHLNDDSDCPLCSAQENERLKERECRSAEQQLQQMREALEHALAGGHLVSSSGCADCRAARALLGKDGK